MAAVPWAFPEPPHEITLFVTGELRALVKMRDFVGTPVVGVKPIIVSTLRRNWPVCGMDFSGSATGSSMKLEAALPPNIRCVAWR
jgi:hypothetical protein